MVSSNTVIGFVRPSDEGCGWLSNDLPAGHEYDRCQRHQSTNTNIQKRFFSMTLSP